MNFSTFKKLAVTSAVALTLFAGAPTHAQETATITSTFATAAALAIAPGTAIDFGTWAINVGGGDTLLIPLQAVTGVPAVPTCSGIVDAATLCINTIAPASSGTVDVTTPAATTVQIHGVVTNDYADATLSLGSLVYTDTVVTDAALPVATSPATLATTTTGGVAETIAIGGTLTISGGTPAASTAFTATDVDIVVQY